MQEGTSRRSAPALPIAVVPRAALSGMCFFVHLRASEVVRTCCSASASRLDLRASRQSRQGCYLLSGCFYIYCPSRGDAANGCGERLKPYAIDLLSRWSRCFGSRNRGRAGTRIPLPVELRRRRLRAYRAPIAFRSTTTPWVDCPTSLELIGPAR
jgi:hypothetical protein